MWFLLRFGSCLLIRVGSSVVSIMSVLIFLSSWANLHSYIHLRKCLLASVLLPCFQFPINSSLVINRTPLFLPFLSFSYVLSVSYLSCLLTNHLSFIDHMLYPISFFLATRLLHLSNTCSRIFYLSYKPSYQHDKWNNNSLVHCGPLAGIPFRNSQWSCRSGDQLECRWFATLFSFPLTNLSSVWAARFWYHTYLCSGFFDLHLGCFLDSP